MSLTRRFFVDIATSSRLDLDAEALRRVEQALEADMMDRRVIPWGIAAGIVVIGAGWAIGAGVLALCAKIGVSQGIAIAFISTFNPLLFVAAWFVAVAPFMRRTVRRTLRECGYNVCGRCGYLLDGLGDDPCCPECGRTEQTALGEARE